MSTVCVKIRQMFPSCNLIQSTGVLMTQLVYVPAFEYSRRRVLGLLGGAGWQLHNRPETRVRQGR